VSGQAPAEASVGSSARALFRLVQLLAALRWRSWRGMLQAGPRVGAARFAALFAIALPVAYVGLLATAFAEMGTVGGVPAQEAALALVLGIIVLSNLLAKTSAGELVVGHGGETELLLARPVSLASLVVARGLAGVVTDVLGALFLVPVLSAAALVWGLSPLAILLAVLTSIAVQVGVVAVAQALQIGIVQLVREGARRPAFVAASLLSAIGMASLWLTGTSFLRAPEATAAALAPWRTLLGLSPGGVIAAPLGHLRAGDFASAALALARLFAAAALALGFAAWVARTASRRGWEQAGAVFAEAAPGPIAPVRLLGLAGKDWRLLTRDRSRLVALVVVPVLFIGVQVFGSAGWAATSASTTRLAMCAYSLAAYAATFGPLVHLEAERRAFWILRAVPVSLTHLFVRKALFWSAVLGGFACASELILVALAGFPLDRALLGEVALVVAGAVTAVWLAVGLGAAEADLSDDARPALAVGSAYIFMVTAGLFNVVLVTGGVERGRALVLFVGVAALAFAAGVARARQAFDAELLAGPRLSPVAGAIGVVLLFLGGRAIAMGAAAIDTGAGAAVQLGWLAAIGGLAAWHFLRNHDRASRTGRWADRLAVGVLAGLGAAAAGLVFEGDLRGVGLAGLFRIGIEELFVRGILQAGVPLLVLARPEQPHGRVRWLAAAVSALAVLAAAPTPFAPAHLAGAILPAVAYRFVPRFALALLVRVAAGVFFTV
jgi:hypothetical protein